MMTQRQRALLDTPRWAWLRRYLDTWCAEPLAASDASTEQQLADAQQHLGPLPTLLREWFELVGARLCDIQDMPARPPKLRTSDGRLVVWTENQGVWQILACPRPDGHWDDDPPCVADEGFDFAQPLSAALQAMTLSDTLVGIMSLLYTDRLEGPLGLLSQQVRGGMLEDAPDWDTFRHYPEHPVPNNPFYEDGLLRGDDTTILRDDSSCILWMTATDDAFTAFTSRFKVGAPDEEHEVVLRLPKDSPISVKKSMELLQTTIGDLGHVGQAEESDTARFWITTRSPDAVVARLLSAIPQHLLADAQITTVSHRLAIPRVVHPVP